VLRENEKIGEIVAVPDGPSGEFFPLFAVATTNQWRAQTVINDDG
jgi:hypothetical protein